MFRFIIRRLLGTLAILRRPTIGRIGLLLGGGGLFILMFALSVKFDFLAARTLVFVTPLLMLVCALVRKDFIMHAYQHAVCERYRFYSYGDCMFLE